MKLFFDESGYSGCIMPNKNGQLFNDGQRHFVLGSVFVADKEDEIEILNKYRQFKNRFGFIGEIKGSELMTQRNNEALKYFITNVLDDILLGNIDFGIYFWSAISTARNINFLYDGKCFGGRKRRTVFTLLFRSM